MATCPKCSKELVDDAKFCSGCGTRIFETIFCTNCGEQTSTEFAFCQNCGASLSKKPSEEQPAAAPAKKKKLPKKAIVFGGIGAAVAAMLIIAILMIFGGGTEARNNYSLYLKDSEIFFSDFKKDNQPWQLTSRLTDGNNIDNEVLSGSSAVTLLGLLTYMSEDGKYIFFPDKIDNVNEEGFNLYYKEAAKPNAKAVKIDSDVRSYTVNTSATLVTYVKGEEGNLYQYKTGKDSKDKLASEVIGYVVSDDGINVWYLNAENSIYLIAEDKEKNKIASDVSSLEYITKDTTTAYYIKEGSLYKQVEGKDKLKIASDIYDVLKIYDSGEI